jgi:hypothetical protein
LPKNSSHNQIILNGLDLLFFVYTILSYYFRRT